MDLLPTLFGSASALLGVLLGGAISSRAQRRSQESQMMFALRGERRDAFASYLASIRQYRRFLMYADLNFEVVPATEKSKGAVLVEGRVKYDAAVDEAYTRLLIVSSSSELIEEARELKSRLDRFVRTRVERGQGNIPDEVISDFKNAELRFADCARAVLGHDIA